VLLSRSFVFSALCTQISRSICIYTHFSRERERERHRIVADMNDIDDYVEMLYEEGMEKKVTGTGYVVLFLFSLFFFICAFVNACFFYAK
jgi:hypothetical protein